VRKAKRDKEAGVTRCPKCDGTQFVGHKTVKGRIAGGFVLAPSRLRCVSCGKILKHA
jgi:hypothetical protein